MARSMENGNKHVQPRSDVVKMADKEPCFSHCQWIYGEGSDREFCRNSAEQGMPWCRQHMVKVYVPASQRQKTLDKLEKQLEMQKAEGFRP